MVSRDTAFQTIRPGAGSETGDFVKKTFGPATVERLETDVRFLFNFFSHQNRHPTHVSVSADSSSSRQENLCIFCHDEVGLLHYLLFAWKLMEASVEAFMEAVEAVEASMKASMELASTKASTEASMEVVEASTEVTSTGASTKASMEVTSTNASSKAPMEVTSTNASTRKASTKTRPRIFRF